MLLFLADWSIRFLRTTTLHIFMSICQGLSPPPPSPPSRHRASSTTLHSVFSSHSIGRRRSSSFIHTDSQQQPSSQPPPLTIDPVSPIPTTPSPSMLVIIASRFLEWFHLQPKHTFSWSTPSSPRSSNDDYVLPLSASAHKTSFGDDIQDSISRSQLWRQGFLSVCFFILSQHIFLSV
jgi:hypothetical protein